MPDQIQLQDGESLGEVAVLVTNNQLTRKRFAKRDPSNLRVAVPFTSATDVPEGVVISKTTGAGDEDVQIARNGRIAIETGGSFKKGDYLKTDGNGCTVKATPAAGTVRCVGQAAEDSAAPGVYALVDVHHSVMIEEGAGNLIVLGVDADAVISAGDFVSIRRSNGYLRRLATGDMFAGVAAQSVDATGQSAGAITISVNTTGDYSRTLTGAAVTDIGKPVFATDQSTLTFTGGVTGVYVGVMAKLSAANTIFLRIRPFALAHDIQSVSVPLSSSTGGATSNPVMCTRRPIIVLSAQVAFNTKPDAGNLDVGNGNSTPNEIVSGFALSGLTNNAATGLVLAGSAAFIAIAGGVRIWAKVGSASSTAGVCGMLTLSYVELP